MNEGLQASGQGGLLNIVLSQNDFFFRLAKGEIKNAAGLNISGRNADVDTGTTPEDIWDVGGIWVPPTVTRIHDLVSTSANDAAAGTGARTVRIRGLTSYSQLPIEEEVTLNGLTPVATANPYVVINEMLVKTFGSSATNAGDISATARVDGTISAQVNVGFARTLMAIFAYSSLQTIQVLRFFMGWSRSGGAANEAEVNAFINLRPDQPDGGFISLTNLGLFGAGNTFLERNIQPYFRVVGPALIKIQVGNVSANNTDVTAGFDAILMVN